MATQSIRIGSMVDVFAWDDADYDSAIETTEPMKAGTPIDPADVLRLGDVGTLAGDVYGPAASTDEAVARFDGVTGKELQNSLVTINDAGDVTLVDDAWIGLGAAKGRIEFDDQATDEVNFRDCRVGIGTAAPTATLEVQEDVETLIRAISQDDYPSIEVRGSKAGSTQHELISFRSGGTQVGAIGVDEANDILTFGRASINDDYMVIDSSGNVGIGETAPATLTEWTSTAPYLTLHNSTEEDGDDGRESRLIFKGEQSGGEETTLAWFHVAHDGALDDEKGYAAIHTNDGSDGNTPTERVRIDSAGNIGIGTASPTSPDGIEKFLEIESPSHVGIVLHETGAGGTPWEIYVNGQDLRFVHNTADRMLIDQDGNVGIGTTSFGTNAAGVLALSNSATPPIDSANLCHLYCEDVSPGNAVLAVYQESAPVVEVDETKFSHKMPIRINGATYYVMLTQT